MKFLESTLSAKDYISHLIEKEEKFNKEFYYLAFYLQGKEKDTFLQLNKMIPEEWLYTEETFGREDKPHCTVFYGLKDNKEYEIKSFMDTYITPAKLEYGEIKSFRNPDKPYDVLYVEVKERNDSLTKVHNYIKDSFDNEWTYDTYTPHMTLAYVKSGKGQELEGYHILQGAEFIVDKLTYIDQNQREFILPFSGVDNVR